MPKPLDVWAFGITVFLYWNDNLPLAYQNQDATRQEFEEIVEKTNFTSVIEDEIKNASGAFKAFLKKVLARDPSQRPTFAEILKDDFFADRQEEKFEKESASKVERRSFLGKKSKSFVD